MSTAASSEPRLRLVSRDDAAAWSHSRRERHDVIRENRAAGRNDDLDPTDPRWTVAVRTQSLLQGSALTPEKRARVMRTARLLGVRPFDANVIIAVVQDQARRGESLAGTAPTLKLLPRPNLRPTTTFWIARWIAVVATAVMANVLLIRWIIG